MTVIPRYITATKLQIYITPEFVLRQKGKIVQPKKCWH